MSGAEPCLPGCPQGGWLLRVENSGLQGQLQGKARHCPPAHSPWPPSPPPVMLPRRDTVGRPDSPLQGSPCARTSPSGWGGCPSLIYNSSPASHSSEVGELSLAGSKDRQRGNKTGEGGRVKFSSRFTSHPRELKHGSTQKLAHGCS